MTSSSYTNGVYRELLGHEASASAALQSFGAWAEAFRHHSAFAVIARRRLLATPVVWC